MPIDRESTLPPDELHAFLGRRETGVLSLARENEPYAIPVSYGFDQDRCRFYLRLVSEADSEKRHYLGSTPPARLVVYEQDGDLYRSVIARGPLEEIPQEELTVEHVEQYGDARRPLFEIWGESKPNLDIALYKLDPTDLSGREIEVEPDVDSSP